MRFDGWWYSGVMGAAVWLAAGCTQDEGRPGVAERGFGALEGVMEAGGGLTPVTGQARDAALEMVALDPASGALDKALAESGCRVDEGAEAMGAETEEGSFVLVVRIASCADGREAWVESLLAADTSDVPLAHGASIVRVVNGEVVTVESLTVEDGIVVRERIDLAEAGDVLGEPEPCTEDGSEVGCVGAALTASQKCTVCKLVAGLVIGQAGKACGWGGVAVCSALGLAGGLPGAVCAASLWALCKYGVSQLKSWGAPLACKKVGYCL